MLKAGVLVDNRAGVLRYGNRWSFGVDMGCGIGACLRDLGIGMDGGEKAFWEGGDG